MDSDKSIKIETFDKWREWAIKIQGIAQSGLYYTDNKYEKERYEQLRDISAEMLAYHSTCTIDQVKKFFFSDCGYATPKMDSRAVCIQDNKILLVQEEDGLWSMPGGWIDVDLSVKENTIKEAKEEAGADVEPQFIIALHDWKKHIGQVSFQLMFNITKIFVMCKCNSVNFQPNNETLQCGFFDRGNLPPLAIGKNNKEQIDICFEAYETVKAGRPWQTVFD